MIGKIGKINAAIIIVVACRVTAFAQQSGSWYYCDASKAYYPYVKDCAVSWRAVVPDDYATYPQRLHDWLAPYKKYPAEAKGQSGRVVVGFSIMHDGTVRDAHIMQSSGSSILDQAALKMLHDASSASLAPSPPPSYQRDPVPFNIPVTYVPPASTASDDRKGPSSQAAASPSSDMPKFCKLGFGLSTSGLTVDQRRKCYAVAHEAMHDQVSDADRAAEEAAARLPTPPAYCTPGYGLRGLTTEQRRICEATLIPVIEHCKDGSAGSPGACEEVERERKACGYSVLDLPKHPEAKQCVEAADIPGCSTPPCQYPTDDPYIKETMKAKIREYVRQRDLLMENIKQLFFAVGCQAISNLMASTIVGAMDGIPLQFASDGQFVSLGTEGMMLGDNGFISLEQGSVRDGIAMAKTEGCGWWHAHPEAVNQLRQMSLLSAP
jgi:TonB family protein